MLLRYLPLTSIWDNTRLSRVIPCTGTLSVGVVWLRRHERGVAIMVIHPLRVAAGLYSFVFSLPRVLA